MEYLLHPLWPPLQQAPHAEACFPLISASTLTAVSEKCCQAHLADEGRGSTAVSGSAFHWISALYTKNEPGQHLNNE